MTSQSLSFTALLSLVAVVGVLWLFADAATHQASQAGHPNVHTPPLTSDVWTVLSLGFR
jgi:hypothetical protein